MKSLERGSLLKKTLASLLGIAGLSSASRAESQAADHPEKICRDIVYSFFRIKYQIILFY